MVKRLISVSKVDTEEVTQFVKLPSEMGTKKITEEGNSTELILPFCGLKMPSP